MGHTKKYMVSAWLTAIQVRNFRLKITITLLLLFACAFIAPIIFQYVQQREGIVLTDYLLDRLPSLDLSLWIFLLLYTLIISGIISLASEPYRFLVTLQAYVLLTALRFITLLLTPLEPPVNIAILSDPFVDKLFYQQPITKDLFFSGHTAILVLFTLALPKGATRKIMLLGSMAIATMLLVQHAHYTIDILAAPVFAWLAFQVSKTISKRVTL